MRTQVGIIGGGPAGLLLSQLLGLQNIESVVLERRDRDYVEHRVRAGVLEQGTVQTLRECGVGGRLDKQGLVHDGLNLRFAGHTFRLDLAELTGRRVMVYGQQEVVKDLIAARLGAGGDIRFGVEDTALHGLDTDRPGITFLAGGERARLDCDFVVGADGSHGISRAYLPGCVADERTYPYAWLGILAAVAPSSPEVIYARHPRGFALLSMRSPSLTRLYLQVAPDEDVADWPDERIWPELRLRLSVFCSGVQGWLRAQGVTGRCRQRSSGTAAVLRQQLERLSMTWPYNGEMAPVEGGDPDHAMPLGQGDHGRIRPAEPQVSVGADQILDALPVGYAEIGYLQLAIDDGRVQACFRLRAKLPVDQVGGFRDDHGRGDQGALVALQQLPAGRVVLIGAIGRRDQRASIDDQHLIASEALGQHLISRGRAAPGSRSTHRGEGQPTARRAGQLRRQEIRRQLICSLAAAGCLSGQRLSDSAI